MLFKTVFSYVNNQEPFSRRGWNWGQCSISLENIPSAQPPVKGSCSRWNHSVRRDPPQTFILEARRGLGIRPELLSRLRAVGAGALLVPRPGQSPRLLSPGTGFQEHRRRTCKISKCSLKTMTSKLHSKLQEALNTNHRQFLFPKSLQVSGRGIVSAPSWPTLQGAARGLGSSIKYPQALQRPATWA